MEQIRNSGQPKECIDIAAQIAQLLSEEMNKNGSLILAMFRTAFGSDRNEDDSLLARFITQGFGDWQGPPETHTPATDFCMSITNHGLLDENNAPGTSAWEVVSAAVASSPLWPNAELINQTLNSITFANRTVVEQCVGGGPGPHIGECYRTLEEYRTFLAPDDQYQWQWRSWGYQLCTEWGYAITSGVLSDGTRLLPSAIDMEVARAECKYAFNITEPPNVTAINKYGGTNITDGRTIFTAGSRDAWLYATPLSPNLSKRESTNTTGLFLLLRGANHAWDDEPTDNDWWDYRYSNDGINWPDGFATTLEAHQLFIEAQVLLWYLKWSGFYEQVEGMTFLRLKRFLSPLTSC